MRRTREIILPFQDAVQTLVHLGLTFCQARVYLALVQSGMPSAKTISKVSGVTRQDVYRIMPKLQELGLAEKIIATPVKFKATPIENACDILLKRKINETSELRARTRELIQNFKKNNPRTVLEHEEEAEFILIPKNEPAVQSRRKALDDAQRSVDIINSWKRIPRYVFFLSGSIHKALKRGVKFRLVTDKPEDKESFERTREILQPFKKHPSFEIRYTLTPPSAVLSVYDKKSTIISTSAKADMGRAPVLRSGNPDLLAVVQDYFEMVWITSLQYQN